MQSPSNAADLNRSLRFQVFQGKPFFELAANGPLTMCVTEQNRIFPPRALGSLWRLKFIILISWIIFFRHEPNMNRVVQVRLRGRVFIWVIADGTAKTQYGERR
jgi:hypothetical protein